MTVDRAAFDFTSITERWSTPADPFQLAAAELRYGICLGLLPQNGTFLEVAVGTGYGLEAIRRHGHQCIGADMMAANLREYICHGGGQRVVQADGTRLPFSDRSADVTACLEALYYIADQRDLLAEAARVTKPGGTIIVCWPNPRRPGFSPSPGSTTYPAPRDMIALFASVGLSACVYGAFRYDEGHTSRPTELARRMIAGLHLMPRSLAARALLKRVVYRGRMVQLADFVPAPIPIDSLDIIRPDELEPFINYYAAATA